MGRTEPWIDGLTRQTVIVHCKHDGPSFKGVQMAAHSDCLVLNETLLLEPERTSLVEGDVVIPRGNIEFIQVLAP